MCVYIMSHIKNKSKRTFSTSSSQGCRPTHHGNLIGLIGDLCTGGYAIDSGQGDMRVSLPGVGGVGILRRVSSLIKRDTQDDGA